MADSGKGWEGIELAAKAAEADRRSRLSSARDENDHKQPSQQQSECEGGQSWAR